MKKLILAVALMLPVLLFASITDPIADFKTGLTISPGDQIKKWACDLNGDGQNEVLLCLKSDYDQAEQLNQSPAWCVYIADASGGTFTKATGTSTETNTLSVGDLPQIDPDVCFTGPISEVGKRGIVAISYVTPRSGITTATIYAYTIEGDHLKRTQLAQYDPDKGDNAVFKKYLADDKRTQVTLLDVTP